MSYEKYIKRCIQLAKNGLGTTYPNPMVGSVVVYNDKIVGEGWHYKAGMAHAEVDAIKSVKDKSLLKKSTIYVSLEPCSHFGKTPPCADLIINSGIKKVIIGTVDPFAKVAGNGIKKLMEAGCEVIVGVLEEECKQLNKRFFTFHNKKRPYIFLKWAQSADGFLSPETLPDQKRKPVWISNEFSKQLVHQQRATEQAILVGTNTVIKDNPSLDTRLIKGSNCLRVIIDLNLRIPKNSKVFNGNPPTIVITKKENHPQNSKNLQYYVISGVHLAQEICNVLYQQNIQSLIIEGGSQTLQTFIDANFWDEANVFTGNDTYFLNGTKAPILKNKPVFQKKIKNNTLITFVNEFNN